MLYDLPRLHRLNRGFDAEGNCANGTGASDDHTCQSGGTPGWVNCNFGNGAGCYCWNGAAASISSGYCLIGTGAGTGCGTGNSPNG